jgi:hypothetical protein
MRKTHGWDEKSMLVRAAVRPYHARMLSTDSATRTVTLVLSESEWRALRDAEPDSIGWLQTQIRNRLAAQRSQDADARQDIAEHDDY